MNTAVYAFLLAATIFGTVSHAAFDTNCENNQLTGSACCPSACVRCDDSQCPSNLDAASAIGSPCCPTLIDTSGRVCSQFKPPCTLKQDGPIAEQVPDICISTTPKNAAWCFCFLVLTNRVVVNHRLFYRDWCLSMQTLRGFFEERAVCEQFGLGGKDIDTGKLLDVFAIVDQKVSLCGGCPRAMLASR